MTPAFSSTAASHPRVDDVGGDDLGGCGGHDRVEELVGPAEDVRVRHLLGPEPVTGHRLGHEDRADGGFEQGLRVEALEPHELGVLEFDGSEADEIALDDDVADTGGPGADAQSGDIGENSFNQVFFTDVRVPRANVVGQRGEGWKIANTTLKHERNSLNSNGEAITLPLLLNCVRCTFTGIGLPCNSLSLGLGSNVSTCDAPPDM